jgi:[acyl-carrier-protein] S-malonyltransferase
MKWVFVFPGQGSQSLGMGKWMFDQFPTARQVFDEASQSLSLDAELTLTANTQPALLCVSTATQKVLQETLNIPIQYTAGHSIGEYASLVLAGVIPFATAMKAVRLRGESMQKAVPVGDGGMIACLGLDEKQIEILCNWAEKTSGEKPVQAANFNCPGQIVLSGNLKALNYLRENFKPEIVDAEAFKEAKRIKFIALNVSAPFHCSMMKPAEIAMANFFKDVEFKNPSLPVVQNLTAQVETDPARLKQNLVAQVSGSVRWTQSIQNLSTLGVTQYVECGHGQVLKGLIKKIDEKAQTHSLQNLEDLTRLTEFFKASGH